METLLQIRRRNGIANVSSRAAVAAPHSHPASTHVLNSTQPYYLNQQTEDDDDRTKKVPKNKVWVELSELSGNQGGIRHHASKPLLERSSFPLLKLLLLLLLEEEPPQQPPTASSTSSPSPCLRSARKGSSIQPNWQGFFQLELVPAVSLLGASTIALHLESHFSPSSSGTTTTTTTSSSSLAMWFQYPPQREREKRAAAAASVKSTHGFNGHGEEQAGQHPLLLQPLQVWSGRRRRRRRRRRQGLPLQWFRPSWSPTPFQQPKKRMKKASCRYAAAAAATNAEDSFIPSPKPPSDCCCCCFLFL